jgi:hypothetical protein
MDTNLITINNEAAAFAALESALKNEFDDKVVKLEFDGWPMIKLKYTGALFDGTITPDIAQAIVDLQGTLNRVYAQAVKNSPNARGLTEEEKRKIQIIVRVESGSSLFEFDLTEFASNIAIELMNKMTPTDMTILVLSVTTVATAGFVLKHFLTNRSEEKKLQIEANKALSLSKEETERSKILASVISQIQTVKNASEGVQEFHNALLKSAQAADTFSIQTETGALTITGDEARSAHRAKRRVPLETQPNGNYLIQSFTWIDEETARLKIQSEYTGEVFPAELPISALRDDQKTWLKNGVVDKIRVYLTINATVLDGAVTTARIVSLDLQPQKPKAT